MWSACCPKGIRFLESTDTHGFHSSSHWHRLCGDSKNAPTFSVGVRQAWNPDLRLRLRLHLSTSLSLQRLGIRAQGSPLQRFPLKWRNALSPFYPATPQRVFRPRCDNLGGRIRERGVHDRLRHVPRGSSLARGRMRLTRSHPEERRPRGRALERASPNAAEDSFM